MTLLGGFTDGREQSEIQSSLLIFIIVLSIAFITKNIVKTYGKRYPPGPWGFPIIGHLPLLGSQPHKALQRLSKKYGDIFSIRMGSWPSVVITSKSLLREALVNQADVFSDRPPFITTHLNKNGKSLGFGFYTPRWKQHRKLSDRIVRKIANTVNMHFEEILQNECEWIFEKFKENEDKMFNPRELIFQTIGGIIYQLLYGKDNNISELDNFKHYLYITQDFVEITAAGNVMDSLPWTKCLFARHQKRFQTIIKDGEFLRQQNVKEHLTSFDGDNLRDVTDHFISESLSLQETGEDLLTKDQLLGTLDDIFGAGLGTTSNTLEWFFLYMAEHPSVQKDIQAEIDNVVGEGRRPCLNDRGHLAYTEATILEVLRLTSVVPMGLPHYAMKDTSLKGYHIAKGTVLIYNAYGIMNDPDTWMDPEKFNPGRFLSENGELNKQKADNVVVFGAGRRKCLGEYVARSQLFLTVAFLLQSFRIRKPLGTIYDFEGICGLTYNPKPYEIVVTERNG